MEQDFSTTFWQDFTIADHFGDEAIQDTYRRAFDEWKTNYQYLTDLVIVLNHKCWEWYDKGNMSRSQMYQTMYETADNYACENLKDKELSYFFRMTD